MDASSEDKRNHSMELKIGKLPRAGEGGFKKKNKKLSPRQDRCAGITRYRYYDYRREKFIF